MSKQQVIVTATPDGNVTVEAEGYKGPMCEKATAAIEAAVGKQTAHQRKPEFHQQAAAPMPQQAVQGAG